MTMNDKRKRYSIYPSPDLDAALEERLVDRDEANDERAEPLRGRSRTITAMCVRYAEIIRQSTPDLTVNEWLLIGDSLNGYWMNDDPRLAAHGVAMNVADNSELNGAGREFGVDGVALARKIEAMSVTEKIAIMDVSERFWAGAGQPADNYEVLFRRLAGHIRETEEAA